MHASVGIFNLNNLFSRFNFRAVVDDVSDEEGGIRLEIDAQQGVRVRSFIGCLIEGKDPADTQRIADRILSINVDVLIVQEVERIEVLKAFNRDYLAGLYTHRAGGGQRSAFYRCGWYRPDRGS